MATTVHDLTTTGIPAAPSPREPFQPTGAGTGYTPPPFMRTPTVTPTLPPAPTPSMPTTQIPEGWTPSGLFQGSSGYGFPNPRILSIPVQKLSGAADIFAASTIIPFPFVIRNAFLWAPASAIGGSSDGTIDLRVGLDPTSNLTAFNSGVSILYPPAVPRAVYCPLPVTLGELWVPFAEGHLFILAHATSLGGATNLQCVAMVGITPLDDYIGA